MPIVSAFQAHGMTVSWVHSMLISIKVGRWKEDRIVDVSAVDKNPEKTLSQ